MHRTPVDASQCCFIEYHHIVRILAHPTPRSTLFPYTTLFRSVRCSRNPARSRRRPSGGSSPAAADDGTRGSAPPIARAPTDRKSTRLNSSHGYNSYAVFCLKKKTIEWPLCEALVVLVHTSALQ